MSLLAVSSPPFSAPEGRNEQPLVRVWDLYCRSRTCSVFPSLAHVSRGCGSLEGVRTWNDFASHSLSLLALHDRMGAGVVRARDLVFRLRSDALSAIRIGTQRLFNARQRDELVQRPPDGLQHPVLECLRNCVPLLGLQNPRILHSRI